MTTTQLPPLQPSPSGGCPSGTGFAGGPPVTLRLRRLPMQDYALRKEFLYHWARSQCKACKGYFCWDQMELDHIHPVFLGGTDDFANIQLLCRPCNRLKGIGTQGELLWRLANGEYPAELLADCWHARYGRRWYPAPYVREAGGGAGPVARLGGEMTWVGEVE